MGRDREGQVSVPLPPELDHWLDERAATLSVDRETLVVQLLAAYRAAADLEDDVVVDQLEEPVSALVEEAIENHRAAVMETVDERIEDRIESLSTGIEGDLVEIKERLLQVKRETDGKAPREHDHPGLDRVDDLAERVESLAEAVERLRGEPADEIDALADRLEEHEDDLAEVESKVRTVANAVVALRRSDDTRRHDGDVLRRLKRSAAERDIRRARCWNCEEGVDVALLPDAGCPSCGARVDDVEPASGFFGKPHLVRTEEPDADDGEEGRRRARGGGSGMNARGETK